MSVSGVHCGTVDFNIKRCKISDMLKIFTMKVKSKDKFLSDKNCTVTILPDYIPLENEIANYADMGLESDEYSKTQKGDDPSEIFDIRDYVEGDKLNRIHWKLSAKQDKTMVKDYSLPIANSIVLMIDLAKADGKADELTLFDSVVETAASVSEYLLENDINFNVAISDQQNYEVMNILNKYQPDIYLSRHPGSTVWATKLGIPAYFVGDEYEIFGYKHTVEFAEGLIYAMKNRSFEESMAKHSSLPYTKWWYEQEVDAFFEAGEEK